MLIFIVLAGLQKFFSSGLPFLSLPSYFHCIGVRVLRFRVQGLGLGRLRATRVAFSQREWQLRMCIHDAHKRRSFHLPVVQIMVTNHLSFYYLGLDLLILK